MRILLLMYFHGQGVELNLVAHLVQDTAWSEEDERLLFQEHGNTTSNPEPVLSSALSAMLTHGCAETNDRSRTSVKQGPELKTVSLQTAVSGLPAGSSHKPI